MSIALQNQVDELEVKVIKLTRQHQELTEIVRQLADNRALTSNPITADTIEHKRRGRPPKVTGHIQPND